MDGKRAESEEAAAKAHAEKPEQNEEGDGKSPDVAGEGKGADEGGEIMVSDDPRLAKVLQGFCIKHMCMRDAENGELLWETEDWDEDTFLTEQEAHVPKRILKCSAVSREIKFSSREVLTNFRLEQRVLFQGICLEEWVFRFGFVIPGSVNTWQQTIEAAAESDMLPAELITGKIVIESAFYDGDDLISKSLVRVFYD